MGSLGGPHGGVALAVALTALHKVNAWNVMHPVGTKVRYWPIIKADGSRPVPAVDTETTDVAFVASSGDPVIFVKDVRGYVHLDHVEAVR